ncbi:putative 4-Hydroxybenzoate polyprenyltransferase [Candidatus Zixiibacteriota bacterium]|nr:putative 4-Hydroxybenzoate polyprenyltransferase [candidate division Zixibacteria bacterium]
MRLIFPILQLVRVHNCLIAGVGVWLGGYLTHVGENNWRLLAASIAAALICAGGNALNDFFDLESDRTNHPNRPLVKGTIPIYIAIVVWMVSNLAAVIFLIFLNVYQIIVGLLAIILLVWYDIYIKKTVLWGNVAVAVLGGATFIFGGLFSPHSILGLPGVLVPALFAFLFHMGREIIKDIADYEGDKMHLIRSLPAVISPLGSLVLVSGLATILIVLTLYPLIPGWYRPAYGFIVILLVDIPLAATLIFIWFSQRVDRFALTSVLMKVMMILGMAAFLFGRR